MLPRRRFDKTYILEREDRIVILDTEDGDAINVKRYPTTEIHYRMKVGVLPVAYMLCMSGRKIFLIAEALTTLEISPKQKKIYVPPCIIQLSATEVEFLIDFDRLDLRKSVMQLVPPDTIRFFVTSKIGTSD